MGTIEVFDHTADVGLRIEAPNLTDLFQTAAEGLFDYIVVNRDEVRETEQEAVSISADSTVDLLLLWLNELIFRSETQHRLYRRTVVTLSPDGLSLQAQILGEAIDRDRHILDHEVKAVTHHGATLETLDEGWAAEVILDI